MWNSVVAPVDSEVAGIAIWKGARSAKYFAAPVFDFFAPGCHEADTIANPSQT